MSSTPNPTTSSSRERIVLHEERREYTKNQKEKQKKEIFWKSDNLCGEGSLAASPL